jgi:hypothetical protein
MSINLLIVAKRNIRTSSVCYNSWLSPSYKSDETKLRPFFWHFLCKFVQFFRSLFQGNALDLKWYSVIHIWWRAFL